MVFAGLFAAGAVGCVADTSDFPSAKRYEPSARKPDAKTDVVQASHQVPVPVAPPIPAGLSTVDELVAQAVGRNPRLSRATFAIDSAQGKYIQAGLYPNPTLGAFWDEIGDRTGPGGIVNIPRFTQDIVTARKLTLSQAVAATEVNQATLDLLAERYSVIGGVRGAFYELYAVENRVAILDELAKLSAESVKLGKSLLDNLKIARLDLVQLEVEQAKFQAEADAARQEIPALRKKLAAAVGDPRLVVGPIAGPFHDVPQYDPDRTMENVLASHPLVRTAKVGVERAQAAVRRAEVEPIPNISFTTGYIRQYENKSHDFAIGFSAPIPTWNRNQGNIRSAKAELGMAIQVVGQVENGLAERVAAAFRTYSAAMKRADLYRRTIIPRAEETYQLSVAAFKGGQFEYLRVVAAQRAIAEARLEYNTSLGEAWKAAAELSALTLEEIWPGELKK
jgi:cobalt-zinc-cadmium efflux system outer membrane protein